MITPSPSILPVTDRNDSTDITDVSSLSSALQADFAAITKLQSAMLKVRRELQSTVAIPFLNTMVKAAENARRVMATKEKRSESRLSLSLVDVDMAPIPPPVLTQLPVITTTKTPPKGSRRILRNSSANSESDRFHTYCRGCKGMSAKNARESRKIQRHLKRGWHGVIKGVGHRGARCPPRSGKNSSIKPLKRQRKPSLRKLEMLAMEKED